MKKTNMYHGKFKLRSVQKFFRVMKITSFLLLIALIQVSAATTYSQSTKLNLNYENVKLSDLLDKIEKASDYRFFYNSQSTDLSKTVSVNSQDSDLKEVLDKVLGSNLIYEMVNNNIVVIKSKNAGTDELSGTQQQKAISGKVTDSSGAPLPGVSVVVKGTTTGVITDMDGKYSLVKVPANATLQFSFVGMKTQEIVVVNKTTINVTLTEETVGLDEVVAVGYGTQRKSNLTGSVSAVKSEKLTIAPVSNVTNALGGQLPGIVTKQNSGQPGADAATLNIRGFGSPLVIVDGVESSLSNLDANQIETVSILKDGAASIYGARAGNGVILVTTKRGNNQKPIITVNSSTTLQGNLEFPVAASAGQRAQMERDRHINSGQPESSAPWTEEAIAKFFAGDDPNYISSDWYNYTTRDWAPQQNHNFSIRGGSEKVKYYGMISYLDQETMIKKAGGGYKRYNIQTNMDASVAKNLTFSADLNVIYEDRKFSSRGSANWLFDMYETKPYLPTELPDKTKPSWGGTATGSFFIASNMDLFGYSENNGRNMRSSASMVYDFPFIKGLKAKAFVNFNDNSNYIKNFARPATSYTYNPTTKEYTEVASANGTQASMSEGTARSSSITQQYSLTYENTFNGIHKVQGLALYEAIDYRNNEFYASRNKFLTPAIEQLFAGSTIGMGATGTGNQMGRASWVGRINYSFRDKYLVETILRADASAKFASDKRWGYFPSISLGCI
jgi:TonB-linked SusC/RagA family outer membrane protein